MSSENVAWRWCGQCGSARWEGDGEPPNPNSITEPEFPPGSSQQDEERTVFGERDVLALRFAANAERDRCIGNADVCEANAQFFENLADRIASLLRSSAQPSQPVPDPVHDEAADAPSGPLEWRRIADNVFRLSRWLDSIGRAGWGHELRRASGELSRAHDLAQPSQPAFIETGDFVLHSGGRSRFRVDVNALPDDVLVAAAAWLAERLPAFGSVRGIPDGGLRFAAALEQHATNGPLLIVDDVLTTGASMERDREQFSDGDAIGAVFLARGPCPVWVTPFLVMPKAQQPSQLDVDALAREILTSDDGDPLVSPWSPLVLRATEIIQRHLFGGAPQDVEK